MIWKSQDEAVSIIKIFLMIIILTATLYFSKDTITGNFGLHITRQSVDIFTDKSQSFILTHKSLSKFSLNSLSVSGEVFGDGRAKIYLDNGEGIRRLVYSNEHAAKTKWINSNDFVALVPESSSTIVLTKYADLSAEQPAPQKDLQTLKGRFRRACSETCELDTSLFNTNRYELLIYVDDGTSVRLNEILYT